MIAPTTSPTDCALTLAAQGVAVLPLKPGSKAPATGDGFYSATTDPDRVRNLFAIAGENAGIGIMPARCAISTGTLIVLDADTDAAYGTLHALFGEPTVLTGGRGAHWYVIVPGDGLPNGLTKMSAKHLGIDLIGAGGGEYVCAPPTHVAGRDDPYRWVGDIYTCHSEGIAWLSALAAESLAQRTERTPRADRAETPLLDEWMRDTSWAELLTEDGWTDLGVYDAACGCPVFKHPHSENDRSAIAHEEGCSKSQSDFVGGSLHVWSSTARNRLNGNSSLSKFDYVAHSRYGGDYVAAREGEDIGDDSTGGALDVDHLDIPALTEANPFVQPTNGNAPAPQAAPVAVPITPAPPPVSQPVTAAHVRDELARIEAEMITYTLNEDGKVIGWDGIARDPEYHERVVKHKALSDLFFTATPELTNLYNAAAARGVNPFGLVTVLIPRILGEIPPNYVLPTEDGSHPTVREAGGSLNTLTYIVGGTSQGKGATERLLAEIYPTDVEIKPSGTAQGIYKTFMGTMTQKTEDGIPVSVDVWYTDSVITTVTEVEVLNAELSRDGSSTHVALCQFYMGEQTGSNTSDKDRRTNLPAATYRFALIVYGQPALSSKIMSLTASGFPGRFMWAPGKKDWICLPIGNGAWHPVDKAKMALIKPSGTTTIGGTVVGFPTNAGPSTEPPSASAPMVVIPWAPAAVAEIAAAQACKAAQDIASSFKETAAAASSNSESVLEGHELFTTIKGCGALAALHGRNQPSDLDWYLGKCLRAMWRTTRRELVDTVREVGDAVAVENARRMGMNRVIADDAQADFKEQRVVSAAETILRRIGDRESWSASEMSKGMFKGTDPERKAQYRDAALKLLVDQGAIVQDGARYRRSS